MKLGAVINPNGVGLPMIFGYQTGTWAIMPAPDDYSFYTNFPNSESAAYIFTITGSNGVKNGPWGGGFGNGSASLFSEDNAHADIQFKISPIRLSDFGRYEAIMSNSASLLNIGTSVGLSDLREESSNNAVYFGKSIGVGSTWLSIVSVFGSPNIVADTMVSVSYNNTIQTMSIIHFPQNTCSFYINGALTNVITASLPAEPIYKIIQSASPSISSTSRQTVKLYSIAIESH